MCLWCWHVMTSHLAAEQASVCHSVLSWLLFIFHILCFLIICPTSMNFKVFSLFNPRFPWRIFSKKTSPLIIHLISMHTIQILEKLQILLTWNLFLRLVVSHSHIVNPSSRSPLWVCVCVWRFVPSSLFLHFCRVINITPLCLHSLPLPNFVWGQWWF